MGPGEDGAAGARYAVRHEKRRAPPSVFLPRGVTLAGACLALGFAGYGRRWWCRASGLGGTALGYQAGKSRAWDKRPSPRFSEPNGISFRIGHGFSCPDFLLEAEQFYAL